MIVLNQTAKNLLLQFVSVLGENRYLTGLLGQSKVGGVFFKIFITRWHYIELGNNTYSILSF